MFVSQENSNKYYKLTEKDDGTFLAEWGRVGASPQSTVYPMSKWDSQLKSKLAKGYTKVAGHGSDISPVDVKPEAVKIANDDVKDLVLFLMRASKQSISSNYSVAPEDVTQAQIVAAQDCLGTLKALIGSGSHSRDRLNGLLENLYRTIPRKMADTRKYFLRDTYEESFVWELLQSEQSLLDTLEPQVRGGALSGARQLDLDFLGLEIAVASQADRDLIAKKTDFKVKNQRIFRVTNRATEGVFGKAGGKTKLLYHGTKNMCWMPVLQQGLRIRPSGVPLTGSMFGPGIYFADRAIKSIGYTSLRGSYWASGSEPRAYLALFEVATGREWGVLGKGGHQHWMTEIDQKMCNDKGYDSVFAKGGADLRNSEYIIYDGTRCTVRYLMELAA
jgi:poly [ADP-ribose] polymerase